MIQVAIVDDHKLMMESLTLLINASEIAWVSAGYEDVSACRKGLEEVVPDVLLLDVALPDGDGVDFCGELKEQYPTLKIILLTSYKEINIVKRALHNGADGYILKNAESAEVILGIEVVYGGEQFLCDEIELLLQKNQKEKVVWLSNREKEVLVHVAEGFTTKEIADRLSIDPETVKTYRSNLLLKLDAKNVATLIKKAYKMKLIW